MKKIIIPILTAVLALSSCSLKEDQDSFLTRENIYTTYAQCKSTVDACYIPLKDFHITQYCWAVEVPTDLWYINTSTVDPVCKISPSNPGQGMEMWRYCYTGVMRCNECIECLPKAPIDEGKRNQLIAECRILRALYYYYLTNFFNGVPFYTYMVKDQETQKKITRLPRTDANVIRRELYDDVKNNALPYLAKVRTVENVENRAGYALGLMLMAKFALWYEDWDAAEAPLKEIEALYGEFSEARYPLDDTRWMKHNTPESIFEIQHAWSQNGTQFAGNICRTYYPGNIALRWDNKDVTDGTGGAWLPDVYEGYLDDVYMPQWGREIPNISVARATWHLGCFRVKAGSEQRIDESATYNYGDRLFDPLPLTFGEFNKGKNRWNSKIDTEALRTGVSSVDGRKIDRRIRYVLGLGEMNPENANYGQTFKEVRTEGRPYAGEKFWVPDMIQRYDSNNYKIFRYADALLMMAEVKCRQHLCDEALNYINLIRERAGVDPFTDITDEEQIMKIIQDERARELAGEFHRKFDLVRWGIWYELTLKYAPAGTKEYLQANIQPFHQYYPIPDTECALTVDENGVRAIDNPEYNNSSSSIETE